MKLREIQKLLMEKIEAHGWALQSVFGDDEQPGFVYTVGLSRYNVPELVIVGMHQDAAARILNLIGTYVKSGNQISGGLTDLGGNLSLPLYLAPNYREESEQLIKLALTMNPRATSMLVVIPDEGGSFPWDSDVSPRWSGQYLNDHAQRKVREMKGKPTRLH